jgi:hypothetical protein
MTMTLDDHHLVGVAMAPPFVPAAVAMFAEFGAGAEAVMVAAFDNDCLSTCNRWCRDGNRAERGNNVSKLPHILLLILNEDRTSQANGMFPRNCERILNSCSDKPRACESDTARLNVHCSRSAPAGHHDVVQFRFAD